VRLFPVGLTELLLPVGLTELLLPVGVPVRLGEPLLRPFLPYLPLFRSS